MRSCSFGVEKLKLSHYVAVITHFKIEHHLSLVFVQECPDCHHECLVIQLYNSVTLKKNMEKYYST